MEKKVQEKKKKETIRIPNNSKKEEKSKNFKVNIKGKEDLKSSIVELYKTKIKKIHIIVSVIALVLYIIFFFSTFSSIGNETLAEGATNPTLWDSLKQNLLLDAVIIFAGITPYFPISIIGLAEAVTLVGEFETRYLLGTSFGVTLFVGGLIEVVAVSLCVAVGLYFCRLETKKRKYYNQTSFGFDDIKRQVYEIRKNEQKMAEIDKKKEEKNRKIQESNVKIPYLEFILLGVGAYLVQIVGILISKI